jgi:RNA polymerase sigma factor (sigma-70 family)
MKAIAASRSLPVHARWWAKAICNAGLVMISPSDVARYDTDDPRNGTAMTEVTFEDLVAEHRRELLVHCYRLLGSVTDAEDVLQEALLAAWRGLDGFEGRASLRSWLYRIATNRCLNALRTRGRRIPPEPQPPFQPPEPSRRGDVTWLQPYPDALLEHVSDTDPSPEARYTAREAIEPTWPGSCPSCKLRAGWCTSCTITAATRSRHRRCSNGSATGSVPPCVSGRRPTTSR